MSWVGVKALVLKIHRLGDPRPGPEEVFKV